MILMSVSFRQVMSSLSGGPFTIQTWEDYQNMKVIDKIVQHCGATPIMEKAQFLSPPKLESNGKVEEKESKKRGMQSSNGGEVKRQRSAAASDKEKAFEEPEWE